MQKIKKLNTFAATAVSLFCATSAFAAEPCKAYVTTNHGYDILGNSKVDIVHFDEMMPGSASQELRLPLTKASKGYIGNIGVGYAANEMLRTELLFTFKPKLKSAFHNIEIETRALGGSARLAYDFNNNTPVTPFVFAELGGESNKVKLSPKCDSALGCKMDNSDVIGLVRIDSKGNPIVDGKADSSGHMIQGNQLLQKVDMKSKRIVTYGAGFGLSFKASDNVNLDLIYGLHSGGSYSLVKDTAVYKIDGGATSSDTTSVDNGVTMLIKDAKLKRYVNQALTAGIRITL